MGLAASVVSSSPPGLHTSPPSKPSSASPRMKTSPAHSGSPRSRSRAVAREDGAFAPDQGWHREDLKTRSEPLGDVASPRPPRVCLRGSRRVGGGVKASFLGGNVESLPVWGGLDLIAGSTLLVDCKTPGQWRTEEFRPMDEVRASPFSGEPEKAMKSLLRGTEFDHRACRYVTLEVAGLPCDGIVNLGIQQMEAGWIRRI